MLMTIKKCYVCLIQANITKTTISFVNALIENIPMIRFRGFSFIELVYSLAIAGISALCTMPHLQRILFAYYAKINLQQIASTIYYARSVAIAQHTTIKICPSADQLRCSHKWQKGMLVIAPNLQRYIPFIMPNTHTLTLQQSGFETFKLTIEANGLTNYNGHFNYSEQNHNAGSQFKLYFNKGLRLYTTKDTS